jgi:ABC-type glutathione transport system ATPase component
MDWTLNKDSERQGIAGGGKTAASSGVSGAPLVKLEHVSRFYQIGEVETHVLIDTSLEALPGEFVVVLGVSGCGKTTLLNLIGALDTPSCRSGPGNSRSFQGRNYPSHPTRSIRGLVDR